MRWTASRIRGAGCLSYDTKTRLRSPDGNRGAHIEQSKSRFKIQDSQTIRITGEARNWPGSAGDRAPQLPRMRPQRRRTTFQRAPPTRRSRARPVRGVGLVVAESLVGTKPLTGAPLLDSEPPVSAGPLVGVGPLMDAGPFVDSEPLMGAGLCRKLEEKAVTTVRAPTAASEQKSAQCIAQTSPHLLGLDAPCSSRWSTCSCIVRIRVCALDRPGYVGRRALFAVARPINEHAQQPRSVRLTMRENLMILSGQAAEPVSSAGYAAGCYDGDICRFCGGRALRDGQRAYASA